MHVKKLASQANVSLHVLRYYTGAGGIKVLRFA